MSREEHLSIQEVADCFTGYPFPSKQFLTPGHGKARVFRGDNLKEGYSEWGDKEKRWEQITPDLQRYQLEAGDVLIGMDGSKVGKNWTMVLESDLPALLGQRVCRIRASELGNQEFLFHIFGSNFFRSYVEQVKTGTSIPHISNDQIRNFCIAIPPLPEQKKIAEILSGIDRKIALLQKKIDLIQSQKRAMLNILYEVPFCCSDSLGNLCEADICYGVLQYNEDGKEEVPVVQIKNLEPLDLSDLKKIPISLDQKFARSRIRGGDLLISVKGSVGKIALLPEGFSGNISRDIARVRTKSSAIVPEFLKYWFASDRGADSLSRIEVGTTRAELSIGKLRSLSVTYPSLERQNEICDVAQSLDRTLSSLNTSLEKHIVLKRGISGDLLSGRKRVGV